jgi:hypothetical protein
VAGCGAAGTRTAGTGETSASVFSAGIDVVCEPGWGTISVGPVNRNTAGGGDGIRSAEIGCVSGSMSGCAFSSVSTGGCSSVVVGIDTGTTGADTDGTIATGTGNGMALDGASA